MNKKIQLRLISSIIIILALFFVGIYLLTFHSGLSLNQSTWGSFGSYFAGTIGVCFSLLGIILLYSTFFEQRKQQFETAYLKYVSDYYSLLNLIKERWQHDTSDTSGNPMYQTGREIFGNAVGYIETNKEREKFIEIFGIHNNVFQHYCNYHIELFTIIDNNNDLTNTAKKIYIDRYLSMLSTYELIFFAYYIKYLYTNKTLEEIKTHVQIKLADLKLTDNFPNIEQIKFIISELK
jgi:hypothetical protein